MEATILNKEVNAAVNADNPESAKKPAAASGAKGKLTKTEKPPAEKKRRTSSEKSKSSGDSVAKKAKDKPLKSKSEKPSKPDMLPDTGEVETNPPVKVLIASSEGAPFITTGSMGHAVGALPWALRDTNRNIDARVVLPLYSEIEQRFHTQLEFIGNIEVGLAWREQNWGVYSATYDGIKYYFLDNKRYFGRESCYGYFDDGERFAYFCKAVFAMLELVDFVPDILHAHDWQTALIPIYLRTIFSYPDVKSVMTIHSTEYQGRYNPDILLDIFSLRREDMGLVEFNGEINLLKGAIVACDELTTVSPTYADEIQRDGGYGLEPILAFYSDKLTGIIDGVDTRHYDPAVDRTLFQTYTPDTIENKAANKKELQRKFNLPIAPRKMLICMVSRLIARKGIDLITYIVDDLVKMDVQLLILGTGEHEHELHFMEMAMTHKDNVSVNIAYNPDIEKMIYAGADAMLMPSRNEACGMAQMVACRFGTVPIARATGGLRDTIRDYRDGEGNGFLFEEYSAGALLDTIGAARDLFIYHEEDWKALVRAAMLSDFSWIRSANEYIDIYLRALN